MTMGAEVEVKVTLRMLFQSQIIREWKEPIRVNKEIFHRAKDAMYKYGEREVDFICATVRTVDICPIPLLDVYLIEEDGIQ